jgi:NitT/TauT family transport system substrate-binding protein
MHRQLERSLWSAALVLAVALSGCGARQDKSSTDDSSAGQPTLTPVSLQLNWYPEAEHGGYYAALVHGYYREAGLDVTIVPGGTNAPVLQLVGRRTVTFGVINADNVLFGRAQQVPVAALAAPLQISPRCLIVHESSGIRGFEDLKNMTIAMSPGAAFAQYLRYKLPLEGVQIVSYSGNVAQFLLDKNFAQQGYVFSEPFIARKEGGDPKVLMVSDLGFNPYTSLLIAHEARLRDDSQLVSRMVAASLRGWKKYIESPETTNEAIHQANPQMDLDILAYGAKALRPLVLDEQAREHGVGTMSHERWQTLAEQLTDSGQLKADDVQVDQCYTTQFLPPR